LIEWVGWARITDVPCAIAICVCLIWIYNFRAVVLGIRYAVSVDVLSAGIKGIIRARITGIPGAVFVRICLARIRINRAVIHVVRDTVAITV
jgi:hypothetical protein